MIVIVATDNVEKILVIFNNHTAQRYSPFDHDWIGYTHLFHTEQRSQQFNCIMSSCHITVGNVGNFSNEMTLLSKHSMLKQWNL